MSKTESDDVQVRLRLIEAAEKIIDRAMQSTLEVRQELDDVLIAAQKFLEREFAAHKC